MKRKIIRLTESDLHRIVKESVRKIISSRVDEVKGLHGNNPKDWWKVGMERYTDALDPDATGRERKKSFKKGVKNMKNANQLAKAKQ